MGLEKKRILFILHLPPPVHGAAVVGQFIKDNDLVNAQFETMYLNLGTSASVDDIGKTGFKKLWKYLCLVFGALAARFRFKPDLIYMTITSRGMGFYKDALIVLLLKVFGKKFVFHFHNKGVARNAHKRLDNWLYKRVFKNAGVILLSELLYDDVKKYVRRENVHVCPNGVEPISKVPVEEQHNAVPQLLFIGNLAVAKGVLDLVDALALLHAEGIEFGCSIVGGEGALSKEELLEKINNLGLKDKVFYEGKKFNDEKAVYLMRADLFIHPSHEECFPLVLLEAMSIGLPAVSTYEGGIPDIVEHKATGVLIQKGDVQALSQSIKELLQNHELRIQMGQRALEKFNNEFTLNHFEARMTEILKAELWR